MSLLPNNWSQLLDHLAEKQETIVIMSTCCAPITGRILETKNDYLVLALATIDDTGASKISKIFLPLRYIGGIEITDSVTNAEETEFAHDDNQRRTNENSNTLPSGRRELETGRSTAERSPGGN